MSITRKVNRRMDKLAFAYEDHGSVRRINAKAGREPAQVSSWKVGSKGNRKRKFDARVRSTQAYSRWFTSCLLRICGHEAQSVLDLGKQPDAYHQRIALRGTTITPKGAVL